MEKKEFKNLVDVLPDGETKLKVFKSEVKGEDGQYIKGSHRSGEGKWGPWYMYKTKVGEEWITIFGNKFNKGVLDSGNVTATVYTGKSKKTGKLQKMIDFSIATDDRPVAEKPISIDNIPF